MPNHNTQAGEEGEAEQEGGGEERRREEGGGGGGDEEEEKEKCLSVSQSLSFSVQSPSL